MPETHTESGVQGNWAPAQCPFRIEYSRRTLEEIRLAVVDAFFAVPRGGLEIGGVLLGKFESGRLCIAGFVPLECEHALGPSFTLSAKDQSRLADALVTVRQNASNLQPVGWYHSHTRSQIFLSEADLEIHSRYFPEPWHIALVLRPSTFQPTRGGFFFREPDGTIHAGNSYEEFAIEPLPAHAVHSIPAVASTPVPPIPTHPTPLDSPAPVEKAEEAPVTVADAEGLPKSQPYELPAFLQVQPRPARSKRWFWVAAVFVLAAAAGVAGYLEREAWLPQVLAATSPKPGASPVTPTPVPITLTIAVSQNQVQIGWDPHSQVITRAESAILEITDAGQSTEIPLDVPHLQAGEFSFLRRGERVDAKLTVLEPGGQRTQATASFFGSLPAPVPSSESNPDPDIATLRRQNAELRKQAARLKSDLAAADERIRELQRQQLLLLERQP